MNKLEKEPGFRMAQFTCTMAFVLTTTLAHISREPLRPVCIVVNYSQNFLHPHLSGSTAGYWLFQVTSEVYADRQKGILSAIVELELHQRIFETDWHILPVSRQVKVD